MANTLIVPADRVTVDLMHRFASGVDVHASIDQSVPAGSILVLFGPSGAGKTTILRAVAGLLRPDNGRITLGGTTWYDSDSRRFVPPQTRGVGYVTQDTALFPHLTVRQNVEYGLVRAAREVRRKITDHYIELVGLGGLEARYPRQLSGGQVQRVALARALAPVPRLLLLDEPFGALDATTRRTLRLELRTILRKTGTSAILVTHDRLEAMAMGDVMAVMIDGRIRQTGPVADVFRRPGDSAVARSLGIETVLPAVVGGVDHGLVTLWTGGATLTAVAEPAGKTGDEVFACIRAEDVIVSGQPSGGSARNHLVGRVTAIEPEGAIERVTIDCGFELVAAITRQSREELALSPGSPVAAAIKATAIHVVPKI